MMTMCDGVPLGSVGRSIGACFARPFATRPSRFVAQSMSVRCRRSAWTSSHCAPRERKTIGTNLPFRHCLYWPGDERTTLVSNRKIRS